MKAKLISALAFSVVLFASCNNDNDNTEINDGRVNFSSGVNAIGSRVSGDLGNTWDAGDPVGIYMVEHETKDISESAVNRLYKAGASGTSTSFSSSVPIYYPVDVTEKVDFIAYHPHNESVTDYIYSINTASQLSQSGIDLMRATADNGGNGYDKSQGLTSINLEFDHKLTKLVFKATPGDGLKVADLLAMTVTIDKLYTTATYNISTDVIGTPENKDRVATLPTTQGVQYEAIVIPQSFAADEVTVEFAMNNDKNEVFVYKVPATTFTSAQKHVFNVTVRRTRIEVSGTIKKWDPIGNTNGIAD